MKVEKKDYTVEDLIALKKDGALAIDPEYQRAPAWTPSQEKLFIDSIMRGYPLPAFYFHDKVKVSAESGPLRRLFIVDGQQRINAIVKFRDNNFRMLDPSKEKGPISIFANGPCPWAGNTFDGLSSDYRRLFLDSQAVAYEIMAFDDDEKVIDNEVRDLFIRLQNGTPLTPQDKRDAWPGKFTDFVLQLGGKAGLNYPGHPFFRATVKGHQGGKKRQLAAQIAMLFIRKNETMKFVDIKSKNIDDFYGEFIDFDMERDYGQSLINVLDKIHGIFPQNERIENHYAIHLSLFVDTLVKNYIDDWSGHLLEAFRKFRSECKRAEEADKNGYESLPHMTEYVVLIKTNSDKSETITRRHIFFCREMEKDMKLTPKDNNADYTPIERECVYQKYGGKCQVCVMNENTPDDVAFEKMAIHRVELEDEQKKSFYDDKALVESDCLPDTQEEIDAFKTWWISRLWRNHRPPLGRRKKLSDAPDGTICQFDYKGEVHEGVIKGGKLVVGENEYKTFSEASCAITGTSRNGWDDWFLQFPDGDGYGWILAAEWRRQGENAEWRRQGENAEWRGQGENEDENEDDDE